MIVGAAFQDPKVTLVLRDMTPDDIQAIIDGLDHDRNHPARAALYKKCIELRQYTADLASAQKGF